jgi:hypothetical protein
MRDNKHIQSFNEHGENLNISDVSESKKITKDEFIDEFLDMSKNNEFKNETANGTKPVLGVVFILFETDDTFGNKGVYDVFNTREKADKALKERCGNDKWCSFRIEEWSVK